MQNDEIRAVEMTRKIRDDMYERTKDLSEEELIRFFNERAKADHARSGAKLDVKGKAATE